jgi:hypothetical protein
MLQAVSAGEGQDFLPFLEQPHLGIMKLISS